VIWDDWKPIAARINRLWPPPMDVSIAEEYFAVLEGFPASAVDKAVTLVAKSGPRQFRPDVGTLYTVAEARVRAAQEALPAPDVDPLSPEDHERALAEERRRQSDEHRRRHEAVVDLLRTTGYRIPITVLPVIMAASKYSPAEFDAALSRHRERALERRA
jgi:hypothetical protein